jgi:hypothetical protein
MDKSYLLPNDPTRAVEPLHLCTNRGGLKIYSCKTLSPQPQPRLEVERHLLQGGREDDLSWGGGAVPRPLRG